MFQSMIEYLGLFVFLCLAVLVVVPGVVAVVSFWHGFIRAIKTRRADAKTPKTQKPA